MGTEKQIEIPLPPSGKQLLIFADAGFRLKEAEQTPGEQGLARSSYTQTFVPTFVQNSSSRTLHKAGLGLWIPALATGVSLQAFAADNNEAEALALALGALLGRIMHLHNTRIITDSRLNFELLCANHLHSPALRVAKQEMLKAGFDLEWRPREETALADFFATLALDGKNFIAKTANAKNPEDKFRALLHTTRADKKPLKDLSVKWLSLPSAPKNPPPHLLNGMPLLSPEFSELAKQQLAGSEFHLLAQEFLERFGTAQRS